LSMTTTIESTSYTTSTVSNVTALTDTSAQSQVPIANNTAYVTQEALPVRDTSLSVLPQLQQLLAQNGTEYISLFDERLFNVTSSSSTVPSTLNTTISGRTFNDGHYVESSLKGDQPFLFTGKTKSRTKNNCYVIRVADSLSMSSRARIVTILQTLGGSIKQRYESKGIAGFVVCFGQAELPLSLLKAIKGLQWVERDQQFKVQYIQKDAPWQLSRLNNGAQTMRNEGPYLFNATGYGVTVYTIDSGVSIKHPEFGGRASIGFSLFSNDFPDDCAGHGTEVASVILGLNVGVAKQAKVIAVQVLDCDGQGTNSAVLAAFDWIFQHHVTPAVINMSLGGPKSPSVDNAVRAAIAKGISVIIAAGNDNVDACQESPSRVDSAMVVGATTMDNQRSSFSNYGSCVSIFAPGEHVIAATVAGQDSQNGFAFVSGTSLSAPLVTGLYALLLEVSPKSQPDQLKKTILGMALADELDAATLFGSPNLLAQAPILPETPGFNPVFLPAGTLPIYGLPNAKLGTLELILMSIGAALVLVSLILAMVVLIRRCLRKRAERHLRRKVVKKSAPLT
jgi:subtilisin family serine protease